MTVEDIKAAIGQLPESERLKLADWFEEMKERAWDAEMERDFSPGGRGDHLVEKINREIDAGRFTPMEENRKTRRKQP